LREIKDLKQWMNCSAQMDFRAGHFAGEFVMSFAAVMVHVELAEPCDQRIRLAAGLSLRFHATLIGATAWEPRPPLTYGGVIVDTEPAENVLQGMSDQLAEMGKHFKTVAGAGQPTEWRAGIEPPMEFLVREARAADLVVVGRDRAPGDLYRTLDPGAAMLKIGRPALMVPSGVDALKAERVVVAWKDTREARLAVRDALPLLREASSVAVVEIADPGDEKQAQARVDDVAGYLARHGVAGTAATAAYPAGPAFAELILIAEEMNADLIVAGGYGHSRLGEWIFGGVTQGLLASSPVCCLLSH
jgi:nucleotide-binding universal stress UspA family protein